MAVVADGTDEAAKKIQLTFSNDQDIGIIRYADAGYETALGIVESAGIGIPTIERKDGNV